MYSKGLALHCNDCHVDLVHIEIDKEDGVKVLCNEGLNAIADLIEHAQNDICRAQRRLVQKGEGVAKSEAASAKACLIMAMSKFEEIGI
jgi:hypothetical protein